MQLDEWLEAYAKAWRERDENGVVELFTEDAVYLSSPFRPPNVGREAIRAYWREATGTQDDTDVRFGTPVAEHGRTVVEWWTLTRESGAEWTIAGALLLRFGAEGLCSELHEYWHSEAGRHTPPDGWGR